MKRLLKYILILNLMMVSLLLSYDTTLAFTNSVHMEDSNSHTIMDVTYRATYRWYYRTVNGRREKRLRDMKKEKWITDWIPA